MSDKYYEDPLESLLDEQSDEEFGMPEIRDKHDHGASEEKHGNLKTWTAEDFSSIYVRFYPHLVRHAKRYLSNDVQAEEVVQDAFLYMLTALPEIDTELGVLKFMKWKVRLLALDVIRATPNRKETLVDSFDDEQSTEETDIEIERADDMAVIGAALAKLNPRHREALIATVYEEKSSAEVAAQMQLSENATRQLVFRARAAFRKALIGEAEVAGKSVSEILSIAAKRAAQGAQKSAATLSALAILVLGASFLPGMIPTNEGVDMAEPMSSETQSSEPLSSNEVPLAQAPSDAEQSTVPEEVILDDVETQNPVPEETANENQIETTVASQPPLSESSTDDSSEQSDLLSSEQRSTVAIAEAGILSVMSSTSGQTSIFEQSFEPNFQTNSNGIPMELRSESGLQAFFFYSTETMEVSSVVFRVVVDGKPYFGVPGQTGSGFSKSAGKVSITHTSSALTFIDQFGSVKAIPELESTVVSIQVNLDSFERPLNADLTAKI